MREIEAAIEQLDDHSLGQLSGWLEEYLAEKWERQFEVDVRAGKLDKLGEAADAVELMSCKETAFRHAE